MSQNSNFNRKLADGLTLIAAFVAIVFSIFQLWQSISAHLSAPVFLPIHLSWVLVLVFLAYPLCRNKEQIGRAHV